MTRHRAIRALLILLMSACGPHLRSGYRANVDSCTCTGIDGGTLSVQVPFAITECEVPADKVIQDCQATVFANLPSVFQDAGCSSNVACTCVADAAFGADCN